MFYNYKVSKLKVTVLMGGRSSEREISLISGEEVVRNLDKKKYEVEKVVWGDSLDSLVKIKTDVVFIAMHGKDGEDGRVQAVLDLMGINYTGSGVLASALGMDKIAFKKAIDHLGVLIPKWQIYDGGDGEMGWPCVVKPTNQGSSRGVSVVKRKGDFAKAIREAKKYEGKVMVEEYIEGIEVSCGVLGNEKATALPVVEICPKNDFFDYEAKYTEGKCEEIVPARISKKAEKEIRRQSVEIFKAIGCRGFARVDFILKESGKLYVLEINTIPGLTPQSLLPKEAVAVGMSYSQLLDKIIEFSRLP